MKIETHFAYAFFLISATFFLENGGKKLFWPRGGVFWSSPVLFADPFNFGTQFARPCGLFFSNKKLFMLAPREFLVLAAASNFGTRFPRP